MKLGATPGFVGISPPVNGHETRSLLAESPARQFDLASARLDAICRRAGSGQADYPGLAEAPNGGRLGLNQQPSGGCRLITDRSQQSAYLAMDLLGESGALQHDELGDHWRRVEHTWTWGAAQRIAGGSDEILKNIVAERVLGLPQDVRVDKDVPFSQLPI
jgi:alkylation response protein AidB-like acyl-CoA dehydrogenase